MLRRIKVRSLVSIMKLMLLNSSQCFRVVILVSTCMLSTVRTEIMGLKQKLTAKTDVPSKG